ncbi:amidophosphoribosyltransferase, partial [Candidatus Saccharibacteria bacterium]|nr:amidophosphoribosyltransferase [Candidatus Saccharibacteria bacterium]
MDRAENRSTDSLEASWRKPGKECGVYGIYQPGSTHLARDTYIGILGLQHRGQDATGIAVFDHDGPIVERGLGLVEEA